MSHNSAQYLDAVWLDNHAQWRQLYDQGRVGGYRPRCTLAPGWYVLRVCVCHRGEVVVRRPYASVQTARACVQLLVDTAVVLGT